MIPRSGACAALAPCCSSHVPGCWMGGHAFKDPTVALDGDGASVGRRPGAGACGGQVEDGFSEASGPALTGEKLWGPCDGTRSADCELTATWQSLPRGAGDGGWACNNRAAPPS